MLIKIIKLLCVGLWAFGFVLLGMSYSTNGETDRLSNTTFKLSDGSETLGRDPNTNFKQPQVLASEKKARLELIGGLSAICGGSVIGLLATMWADRRYRRKRSRTGLKSDHLAAQFHRARHS